jgi:hypothetical protein
VAQRLIELGHGAVSVHDVELAAAADDEVFELAVVEDRLRELQDPYVGPQRIASTTDQAFVNRALITT